MKLILDNIIFSRQHIGGISNYWAEIWSRLLRSKISAKAIENKDAENNFYRSQINIPTNLILRDKRMSTLCGSLSIPFEKKIDLFHSSYYRRLDVSIPSIQTCYDFTYERFRRGPAKWIHSFKKKKAILSADGVICISHSTRRDLHSYYPEINPENTCVIYLGYSSDFKPLSKKVVYKIISKFTKIDNSFSLFVGSRDNYKNFFLAVDSVSLFNKKHILVLVGGGKLSSIHFKYLNLKLKNRWLKIDNVSKKQLNVLYNGAHALLYLSNYEGFGIPVIEAMATGCPVIALKTASLPEVAGDAGILINNINVLNVADELTRLENTSFRKNISNMSIENSKKFSWQDCFQETISFYKKVLNK